MTLMCWLLDENGDVLASFEEYEQLDYERPYQTSGSFNLRLARNTKNASLLEKGLILGVDEPNKPAISQLYRIEEIIRTMSGDGSEGDTLELSGRSLSGVLEERICIPPNGEMHDEVKRMPAGDAMRHYVNQNIGPAAKTERQIPNLMIGTDGGNGPNITYQARYQPLSEVLLEIGQAHNLGWEITYNRTTKQYVFDLIAGTNWNNPPVFDIDLGSATAQAWLSSDIGKKNYSYVAGQGEGAERVVISRFLSDDMPEPINYDNEVDMSIGTRSATEWIYDATFQYWYLRKTLSTNYHVGLGTWESPALDITSVGMNASSLVQWVQGYRSDGTTPASDEYSTKVFAKGNLNGETYPWVELTSGQPIPFLDQSTDLSSGSTITLKVELNNTVNDVTPTIRDLAIHIEAFDPYASQEWYFENFDSGRWSEGVLTDMQTVDTGGIKLSALDANNIIDDRTEAAFDLFYSRSNVDATTVTEGEFTSGALQLGPSTFKRGYRLYEGFENEDPDRGGTQYPFAVTGDWVVTQEKVRAAFMNAHSYRNAVKSTSGTSSAVTFTMNIPAGATNMNFRCFYSTNSNMSISGRYKIYVDNVIKLDLSTTNTNWTEWAHTFTTTGTHTIKFEYACTSVGASDGRFFIDDVELTYDADYTGFAEYGERISQPKLLTSTGLVAESSIDWEEVTPFTTWLDVYVGLSNSATVLPTQWAKAVAREAIPFVTETGMSGKYVWVKQCLYANPKSIVTPYLKDLQVSVGEGYLVAGQWLSEEVYFRNAGKYLNGHLAWEFTSLPVGSTVVCDISYDNGLSWIRVNNGEGLPGIKPGTDISNLSAFMKLSVTKGTDGTSPHIKRFVVHINKEYGGYEPIGYERREVFVDARDLSETESLGSRGQAAIQETINESELFETTVDPYGPFKYGIDWDMGDIVTVMNKHWGVSQNLRVVGVAVSQHGDTVRPEMTVSLGAPWPNLVSKIKKLTKDGGSKRT